MRNVLLRRAAHISAMTGKTNPLDPAVLDLLRLDPTRTRVSPLGGGGCSSASTAKITTTLPDGRERRFFMKTGSGKDAQTMFRGEHASLSAIHDAVPNLCPASFGWGTFQHDPQTAFLVTEFLDLTGRRGSTSYNPSTPSLAAKLAQLHTTPAPIPAGYDRPVFGFPVPTCCGDTVQDNRFQTSWATFYAENRLRFILREAERRNGPADADAELRDLVERTADAVVPRLLGDDRLNGGAGVTPVVVHGDLWSGNASRAVIGTGTGTGTGAEGEPGAGEPQDVVFDASAAYAHSEYELGIMRMFGGFGAKFLREYHALCPKTEPVEEYEDRVALYELYHHLNHYALFGGGYRSGAVSIMTALIRKYA